MGVLREQAVSSGRFLGDRV